MTADDPNSVADALDAWADHIDSGYYVARGYEDKDNVDNARTAARLLRESAGTADQWHKAVTGAAAIARRHADLLDAIGDPEDLRYEADCYEDAAGDLAAIIRRIADAADAAREDR